MAKNTSDADVVTIDLQPFLLPFAIVISAIILSISMYYSASKLAGGDFGDSGNTANVGAGTAQPPAAGDAGAPAAVTQGSTNIDDDAVKGNKDEAKVAIVEFSDYECPFCQRFYSETLNQVLETYVDSGDAIFVYRDLPLDFHPKAQIQAEAAECAGEEGDDKYYEMHNAIFDKGGQLDEGALIATAEEIGLNKGDFESCLKENKMADEVNADKTAASAAGVNGTPGFIIGTLNDDGSVEGEVVSGAQPFASFQTAVEKYL